LNPAIKRGQGLAAAVFGRLLFGEHAFRRRLHFANPNRFDKMPIALRLRSSREKSAARCGILPERPLRERVTMVEAIKYGF
jgi:hypothetical protein